jgi:hypothetical protein
MFQNSNHKLCAVLFSGIGICFTTPLLFGIIHFEKNNHHRTLINQLVSSIIWHGILWNGVLQLPIILRYMLGPFPTWICFIDIVIRNMFITQGMLFLDAIIIVRYVFLFHVKNPTALQDDFWRLYLNLWTLGVSICTQVIYIIMPGKNPQNYYMCLGYYPTKYNGEMVKPNSSINYFLLFSFIVHMLAGIRIKLHRRKEAQIDKIQTITVAASLGHSNMMMNFTTNITSLLLLILSAVGPAMLNKMEPLILDTYPNFIWVYISHHYWPPCVLALTALIYYSKNPPLRNFLWVEMLARMDNSEHFKKIFNYLRQT